MTLGYSSTIGSGDGRNRLSSWRWWCSAIVHVGGEEDAKHEVVLLMLVTAGGVHVQNRSYSCCRCCCYFHSCSYCFPPKSSTPQSVQ